MIVEMDKVFKLHIVIKSDDSNKVTFQDPYEVRIWSDYFGVRPKDLLAAFCFYILRVLKLRVQHSIETQTINGRTMKSLYTELSLKYKKQNPKNIGRFWKDTEFLMNNIKVWHTDTGRTMFGIPKNIRHPSGVEAYKLFYWLEFGTKRKGKQIIPPRPLIIPHFRFIIQNISEYWKSFIQLLLSGKLKIDWVNAPK